MLKKVVHVASRLGQRIAISFGRTSLQAPVVKVATKAAARGVVRVPYARNLFLRTFQRTIRSSRLFIRPLATLHYQNYQNYFNQRQRNRFRGLRSIYKRPGGGVVERIRDLFGQNARYNRSLAVTEYPDRLDGYDIGNHIATGCSGAVYELRRKNPDVPFETAVPLTAAESFKAYPLALKVVFNYDFSRPEYVFLEDMGPELVAMPRIPSVLRQGSIRRMRTVPHHHPNIIKVHAAFTDVMPLLRGARDQFPAALPGEHDFIEYSTEPRTLFIVMKRYHMTLRDYVVNCKRNYWTSRVLFGQLLEAIVFLHKSVIAHRDLKSDNILVEFDTENEIPHLAVTDFGCALATGSFDLPYHDTYVYVGGNLALRAPEVARAKPGPGKQVNFELSDLWAAGTLGYEIFTRSNPFYHKLHSGTYSEADLPTLPRRVNYAVKQVISKVLSIDPAARPKPEVAANVVSISLFRYGQDVRAFLEECGLSMDWNVADLKASFSKTLKALGKKFEQKLDNVTGLYAAETIVSRLISPSVISPAELQLRATFLARLDRDDIWPAMEYFFDEDAYAASTHASSRSSRAASSAGSRTLSSAVTA